MKVPLVPIAATKWVMPPAVWRMISGPVCLEMRLPVGGVVVLVGIKVEVRIGLVDFPHHADGAIRPSPGSLKTISAPYALRMRLRSSEALPGSTRRTRYPRLAPIMA